MKYTLGICRVLPLLSVGLILVACGGDAEESGETESDTLAISTQPANQIESSPPGEPTNGPGEAVTEDPPSPTSGIDDQSVDPPVNSGEDVPDDPWGKDIPEGPAPTAPPNPSSDFDADGDGFYTLEELEEAIRFRYGEYEWPQNYVLDLDAAIEAMYQTGAPPDAKYEAPGEYTSLGLYHICASGSLSTDSTRSEGDDGMKSRIKALLAVVLCVAVMSPAGVSATGYENIGGYAGPDVEFFETRRYVSNPATPGPEVAFYQYTGPPGLFLGAWGCPGGWAGGPLYKQSIGSWQPVAYSSSPMTFCLFSSSNSGSGNFNGDLSWD